MQPLTPSGCCLRGEGLHEGAADAPSLVVGVDSRVECEGMRAAVPAGVDETDQRTAIEGADPGQAVAVLRRSAPSRSLGAVYRSASGPAAA